MAGRKEATSETKITEKSGSNLPGLIYVDGESLPADVESVVKEIQKYMTDDRTGTSRPRIFPSMPRRFLCNRVVDKKVINNVMMLAGEDQEKCPDIYELVIPFGLRQRKRFTNPPVISRKALSSSYSIKFSWFGCVLSFSKVSKADENLVVIDIKEDRVVNASQAKHEACPEAEERDAELPLKPKKKFLESPLVVDHSKGCRLVSSHKMTISWLRSRLHRAFNRYQKRQKDKKAEVVVIPTIRQKDGGPLLLHLHVEKNISGKMVEHDLLVLLYPAFQLSSCHFVVPAFEELGDLPFPVRSKYNVVVKQCLWKIVNKCCEENCNHIHSNNQVSLIRKYLNGLNKTKEKNPDEKTNDKSKNECSIRQPNDITTSQAEECGRCVNPASRMLLEYYYQYGHIPEDEKHQTGAFVTEILRFIHDNINRDRKENEPKIVEFVMCGSVAEGLKVVTPDEFDVTIKIDLPKSTHCYTFLESESFPSGYVICQVKRSNTFSRSLRRCFQASDGFGHCLAPDKLAFGWLHGKVVKAINKYEEASPEAHLKLRRRGPALVLQITPNSASSASKLLPPTISVDLVLALKMSESDSRYAVAKRATEELWYKEMERKLKIREEVPGVASESESSTCVCAKSDENKRDSSGELTQEKTAVNDKMALARSNLKYLWRISYSAQEKMYLERVREDQRRNGVEGCQDVCLMILKTVRTQEVLKQQESVLFHKLSSYILKTALFHVLANTDLVKDWTIDCLADRYVDLLDRLSKWKELPHFFFNNASHLKKMFPDDDWWRSTVRKDLLDELHATSKNQMKYRFAHIASSFKECKTRMDAEFERLSASPSFAYVAFLNAALDGRQPEEVIHPPFNKAFRPEERGEESLAAAQARDNRIVKAAKAERKCGPLSDPGRNLQRPKENYGKSKRRRIR